MTKSTKTAFILWLLFTTVCVLLISRATFSTGLSAFLPSHPTATQKILLNQLQNGIATRIILVGIEGADTPLLARISKTIAHRLRPHSDFVSVHNGEAKQSQSDRHFIFSHRYLLSPADTPAHFTASGMRDAIQESLGLLASPAGFLFKHLFVRDPTGEMLKILRLFDGKRRPRLSHGVWFSKDGKRALMLVQTRASASNLDAQQRAIRSIRSAFNRAKKINGAGSARLLMTGPSVFAVASRNNIKHEVERLSTISTAIIVGLLWTVFRSPLALILGLLPVATAILAGIAAVSLVFGDVHGVTLGFGITLIGEAVDYSIYLFIQSQDSGRAHATRWIDAFWPTVRIGMMTSVIGFSSLLFSGFPELGQLGLYSTAGLIAAAMVARFVLPPLLPGRFHTRDVSHLGKAVLIVVRHAPFLRWITIILAIAAALFIYTHRHKIWSADLEALSPVSTADRALDASLRKDLGAPDPRYLIIVSGDSANAVLFDAHRVGKRLQRLVEDGTIDGYDSPSRYLPSLKTQNMRKSSIPPKQELTKRLHSALSDLPISIKRLAPFVRDAERARTAPPLTRKDLLHTSLAVTVDAMLVKNGRRWNALLPLRLPVEGTRTLDTQRIHSELRESGVKNAALVDVKSELNKMYGDYLRQAIHLSLFGLAAILVFLLISLRSIRSVARLSAPLACAILVVLASLLFSGHQLTIPHLIGLLLTVAVGSNYALFFYGSAQAGDQRATKRTFASLLLANMSTVIVFGLLASSTVPVLQDIGLTVTPGVVLALLFSCAFTERKMGIPNQ